MAGREPRKRSSLGFKLVHGMKGAEHVIVIGDQKYCTKSLNCIIEGVGGTGRDEINGHKMLWVGGIRETMGWP
jgi:hypothetical protein